MTLTGAGRKPGSEIIGDEMTQSWRRRPGSNDIVGIDNGGLEVLRAKVYGSTEEEIEATLNLIEAAPELLEGLKLAGIIIQGEWLNLGDAINRAGTNNIRDQLQEARDHLNRIRVKVNTAIAKAEPS